MSQQPTPASPPPAKPSAPPTPPAAPKLEPVRAKELGAKLTSRFSDLKVEYAREHRLKVTTAPAKMKEVALFARDELGFDHISTVSAVDWIAKSEFEVVYFVGSVKPGWTDFVLAISERIPRDSPSVPTLVEVWTGADYNERETHEMFGVEFQGHPSKDHLLLPEDWNDIPPLRKDYISPGR